MPTNPDNLSDVQNWPNLVFKWLLSILGGAIFVIGTALYGEVKELNKALIRFNETLSGTIKDYAYLKSQVDKMEVRIDKHIERSDAEKKELREELEILRYQRNTR